MQVDAIQREVIEKLYKDFYSEKDSLGSNILDALIYLSTNSAYRDTLFEDSEVTVEQINDAFYPEE